MIAALILTLASASSAVAAPSTTAGQTAIFSQPAGAMRIAPGSSAPSESRVHVEVATPSAPLQVETTIKHENSAWQTSHEWWLVIFTGVLAAITGALALYTGRLYRATVNLGNEAKTTGDSHAARMEASISEAARAATAQEGIAKATNDNAILMHGVMHKQMRAYVSVEFFGAIHQDDRLLFQVDLSITNTGFTPAMSISYSLTADLMTEIPQGFEFAHFEPRINNDMTLAPRQAVTISAVVRHRVPDGEVEVILRGEGKKLYAWGTLFYKDIWGSERTTDFCQIVTFRRWVDEEGKDRVNRTNNYHPTHNSAT